MSKLPEKPGRRSGDQKIKNAPRRGSPDSCLLTNRDPEPSGEEGLADVRIIRALYQSMKSGAPVALAPYQRRERPSLEQEIRRPPVEKPAIVHAQAPSGGT